MKTLTVVGARPQFIKAAPVIKLLDNDVLVHTGQHYDKEMSNIFFSGLNIKNPDYNLNVGSGKHVIQITNIVKKLTPILKKERPDAVIVYGDTNSTVAAAFAAKLENIKLIHIEAGLRSYNCEMPEEINRVITDKLADVLICPTTNAYLNLTKEGLHDRAVVCGDTMNDLIKSNIDNIDLLPDDFYLCTLHRPVNVDNDDRLKTILESFSLLEKLIIFPCHPRTMEKLNDLKIPRNVKITMPVGYFEMLSLASSASRVITDSGGLQKEAHILRTPCVTLRDETEWIESIESGCNKLCAINKDDIVKTVNSEFSMNDIEYYGDGCAAEKIVGVING